MTKVPKDSQWAFLKSPMLCAQRKMGQAGKGGGGKKGEDHRDDPWQNMIETRSPRKMPCWQSVLNRFSKVGAPSLL